MFYIRELYLKFLLLLWSFSCVFIVLYFNKFNLIWLTTSPLLYYLKNTSFFGVFIYTHPIELFNVIINLTLYFTIIILFPYFLWLIMDFFKSGFYLYEYLLVKQQTMCILFVVLFFNFIEFIYFLPSIWIFFESFTDNKIEDIKILMEIKIQDFFYFIFDYILTLNFLNLIICFYLYFIIYSITSLLKNKKLMLTLNILFATIISPPEFIFQLILFLILLIFSESLILLFLFFKILSKVIN